MIRSLAIKNFKCLENLEIRTFNRINLLTGKNNTGKSTLLEAVALFFSDGNIDILNRLFEIRGINFEQNQFANAEKITSLFSNWKLDYSDKGKVSISEISSGGTETSLSFRLVKFVEEDSEDGFEVSFVKRTVIDNDHPAFADEIDINFGLQRTVGDSTSLIPLDRFGRMREVKSQQQGIKGLQFVRPGVNSDKLNSKLWDKIALTSKETRIVEALKIVYPSISGLSFVQVGENRVPIARLSDPDIVVPLKSMGDGMNRILTLLLALVNAENGVLLVDEFENGLHYSVQKELWKMIFNLSVSLGVQVFVTTHSTDCIEAFTSVMEGSENLNIGTLIRLDNRAGRIESVEYSPDEMKIAKQYDLETR